MSPDVKQNVKGVDSGNVTESDESSRKSKKSNSPTGSVISNYNASGLIRNVSKTSQKSNLSQKSRNSQKTRASKSSQKRKSNERDKTKSKERDEDGMKKEEIKDTNSNASQCKSVTSSKISFSELYSSKNYRNKTRDSVTGSAGMNVSIL